MEVRDPNPRAGGLDLEERESAGSSVGWKVQTVGGRMMIDKIAAKYFNLMSGSSKYDELEEFDKLVVRRRIRAVLSAAREPSKKLLSGVMQASLDCTPINRCEQQALKVWQNTIDAILEEDDE
jgi:hypothetical protein